MTFIIKGFIWDIPILIFAYVLFGGPVFASGLRFADLFLGYGLGRLGTSNLD